MAQIKFHLVSSFKPSKFWVEEILFGSGLINFSIRFLNVWHEDELRILISRLFHSVITTGKNEFLKNVFFTLKKGLWLLTALRGVYELLLSGSLTMKYLIK